ncbi:MAG: hypothetical protein IJK45_09145 [Bacteroidaceae bacterium]|nr:hypothetical protein [Bacteroidaceae bacterium]
MNEYIFYTTEGYTIAPNEEIQLDNCQVLGFAMGDNVKEATEHLLKENLWIIEAGFNAESFIVRQLQPTS